MAKAFKDPETGDKFSPTIFGGECVYFLSLPVNRGKLQACTRYKCPRRSDCLGTEKKAVTGQCTPFNKRFYPADRERPEPKPPCTICGGLHYGLGYCKDHYMHNYKWGHPTDKGQGRVRT